MLNLVEPILEHYGAHFSVTNWWLGSFNVNFGQICAISLGFDGFFLQISNGFDQNFVVVLRSH